MFDSTEIWLARLFVVTYYLIWHLNGICSHVFTTAHANTRTQTHTQALNQRWAQTLTPLTHARMHTSTLPPPSAARSNVWDVCGMVKVRQTDGGRPWKLNTWILLLLANNFISNWLLHTCAAYFLPTYEFWNRNIEVVLRKTAHSELCDPNQVMISPYCGWIWQAQFHYIKIKRKKKVWIKSTRGKNVKVKWNHFYTIYIIYSSLIFLSQC